MADLSVLDGENRPGSERLSVRLADCGNDRTDTLMSKKIPAAGCVSHR